MTIQILIIASSPESQRFNSMRETTESSEFLKNVEFSREKRSCLSTLLDHVHDTHAVDPLPSRGTETRLRGMGFTNDVHFLYNRAMQNIFPTKRARISQ